MLDPSIPVALKIIELRLTPETDSARLKFPRSQDDVMTKKILVFGHFLNKLSNNFFFPNINNFIRF